MTWITGSPLSLFAIVLGITISTLAFSPVNYASYRSNKTTFSSRRILVTNNVLAQPEMENIDGLTPNVRYTMKHQQLQQGTFVADDSLPKIQDKNFPFHMIVGNHYLKQAAVIAASNPNVRGILIGGRHGTGKSIMARAIHQLLPDTIDRVKGSSYNIEPTGKYGIDSILLNDMMTKNVNLNDLETERIMTPYVQVPLNVMEDSLVGTIDIESSMEKGEPVFAPGLLAKAHRGILYIDDIYLLDGNILNILFDVISDGWVMVEREGLR